MPQAQKVSDSTLDKFIQLSDADRRSSLTRMDPEAKQALYDAIQARKAAQGGVLAPLSKATGITAQPKMFSPEWFRQGLWRAAASTADVAPAAGGTIGGMLGMGLGPEAAVGGAGFGGMGGAAAQQLIRRVLGFPDVPQTSGEAAKDITGQGVTQASIQALMSLLSPLGRALRGSAVTQYERALAPTTKINKAITREIVPELIRRGERGSLGALEERAGERIASLNPQLEAEYQALGPGAPVQQPPPPRAALLRLNPNLVTNAGTKVIQDLDALKKTYMPGGVVAQPQAVKAIEGIQDIVRQYGPDIDANHLRRLRQIFEEVPAQRGAYAGTDLSTQYTLNAQKHAADSIRSILNSHPDIGALNKEISFWLDVQRVTRESGLRRTGQAGGLQKVLGPLATATVGGLGFAEGGAKTGAVSALSTALATAAYQIRRSPTWMTLSALSKNRIANAIARGDVQQMLAMAARLGLAGAQSKTLTMNPANQEGPQANR
jgi:hypothetical protein